MLSGKAAVKSPGFPAPRIGVEDGLEDWPAISRRAAWITLAVILVVGTILRVANLGQSPPGLNQDEAINAWNAHCLLKTGKDQVGVAWPIFYSRAIGENRTTLYYYFSIPFQAMGGLNVVTTRLPSADRKSVV